MPDPQTIIKPGQFSMEIPGQISTEIDNYFRNAFARNAGLRIDHLLLSPPLADRLVDAQVDVAVRGWEKSSDHAPVWIELADKAVRRRRSAHL
jgi:exodeoxyribonuclease III